MASTIKVDNVQNQPGTNIINKCSVTTTIGAGAGETIKACAATVTLGRCGGTVSLASGATQSGFGREGSVDWQTGSIKTTTVTAVDGEGYFCNTSGGAFTVNLPAGSAGAIVAVADYTRSFATYNLTVAPNGSEKIGGVAEDAKLTVDGQSATFVYVDGTEGWINVQETQTSQTGIYEFICASVSGACNTLTTAPDCSDVKIATFLGPGTFTVNAVSGTTPARNTVGYQVVAGGGGGGWDVGGGGGAGGYREGRNVPIDNFTASPLVANVPTNAVTVTATPYPITVGGGGGGSAASSTGNKGSDSVFSTITGTGGGYGGNLSPPIDTGGPGGSGGGGGGWTTGPNAYGPASPTTSPIQGNVGGANPHGPGSTVSGGGGGGAGGVGTTSPPQTSPKTNSAAGGAGVSSSITGSPVTKSVGGDGRNDAAPWPGAAEPVNSGNGGQGGGDSVPGGNDGGSAGSGIVIIRYKFQ